MADQMKHSQQVTQLAVSRSQCVLMFLSQHGFALLQTVACGGVLKKTLTSAKVHKMLIFHTCDFWNEKCLAPSLEACKWKQSTPKILMFEILLCTTHTHITVSNTCHYGS
jgi:hypothetical protein